MYIRVCVCILVLNTSEDPRDSRETPSQAAKTHKRDVRAAQPENRPCPSQIRKTFTSKPYCLSLCVKVHVSGIDWSPLGGYDRRTRGQGAQESDDSAVISVRCSGAER